MSLNRLNQKQVLGDNNYTFETLQTQLSELEGRTRVPAKLAYNTYTQWASGENTNTDYNTLLDKITIAEGQTSATFVSYIIDTGGFSNVKFNMLESVEVSGAENGSTQYETRTADTEEDILTATWNVLGAGNKIVSTNGRYIQFRITMTKATYSPVVTSVAIVLYGAAVTQEVYDARGGYKNLANRLDLMNDMARIEYSAAQDQTTFALPSGYIATGSGLKIFVYVGGMLQKYGSNDAYTFNTAGTSAIFNDGLVEGDTVTIIAYRSGTSSTNSSLEDLLATKANLDSPTFTGTVGGITKSMVGLGNVDNTSDLDKPVSNATLTTISTAISTEKFERTAADNILTTNISVEASTRLADNDTLTNRISTEESTRVSMDTLLSASLSSEISNRTSTEAVINTSLLSESSIRTSADNAISALLSSEIVNRSTAVSTEASIRFASDIILSTDISSEVSARTSMDATLSTAVSTEASTRLSVDNAVSAAVSTEIANRSTAVSSEASSRISADNVLTASVNTEVSARISADATMTLQKVYDQSTNGTITLSTNKVFKVLDDEGEIYFQCDPAETNATYVSMTGPVEISGDMVISGKLTVSGTSTIINSEITDSDHMLLSPATGSTTAFTIKPDAGVTLTNPIVDLYTTNAGLSVFNINSAGNTTIGGNLTITAAKTIDMGANKVTNVANGTVSSDVATYGQLSTSISTEASTRTSVDTLLSTNISSEVSSRISATTALSTNVSTAISTAVRGMKKIISGSGTFVGNKQIETATVAVTTVTTGSINVIVTANGMNNSPKTVAVATAAGQTADTVTLNIRSALSNDADVSAFFIVSGTNNLVVLTAKAFAEFDTTMNINIVGGYGVTVAPTSVDSITATTVTFGTAMSDTNYAVSVTPTQIPTLPASLGEIYVVKSTTGLTITNTGSGTATFDYIVTY
jgi:hypothetical protein